MLLTEQEIDDISREMVKGCKSVNWLAQKIESAVLEKLKSREPDAWQIRNGLLHAGIRSNQPDAELTAANMQKCHDLGGSLAAFNVRPLYAHPLPPDDVVRDTLKQQRDELALLVADFLSKPDVSVVLRQRDELLAAL